jgi:hypothetical protein
MGLMKSSVDFLVCLRNFPTEPGVYTTQARCSRQGDFPLTHAAARLHARGKVPSYESS